MSTLSVLILPGDGIGQECMHQTRRVLDWIARAGRLTTEISEDSVGGTAYDSYGTPLADKTLEKAKKASMILVGATSPVRALGETATRPIAGRRPRRRGS